MINPAANTVFELPVRHAIGSDEFDFYEVHITPRAIIVSDDMCQPIGVVTVLMPSTYTNVGLALEWVTNIAATTTPERNPRVYRWMHVLLALHQYLEHADIEDVELLHVGSPVPVIAYSN